MLILGSFSAGPRRIFAITKGEREILGAPEAGPLREGSLSESMAASHEPTAKWQFMPSVEIKKGRVGSLPVAFVVSLVMKVRFHMNDSRPALLDATDPPEILALIPRPENHMEADRRNSTLKFLIAKLTINR